MKRWKMSAHLGKKDRPWHNYDQVFVKGCSTMKLESIVQYEALKLHVTMKTRKAVPVTKSQAAKCLYRLQ